jgi:hypothetical protein
VREAFEEGLHRHLQYLGNLLQAPRANAVRAFFIFLHLLEGQAECFGESGLGHAKLCATRAQLGSHMLVSWMCDMSWHGVFVSVAEDTQGPKRARTKAPLARANEVLQFSDWSPADGMNATFKFTGLRQAPLAALQTGYTALPCVGKRDDVARLTDYRELEVAVDEASAVGTIEGASMITVRLLVDVRPFSSVAT